MPSIRAHALSFSFVDARPLFVEASFHLAAGLTALVGENGSGKTTLLRLIAGELRPESGHVQLEPKRARVVVCAQQAPEAAPALDALLVEPRLHELVGQLGLELDEVERWRSLSFGERKRWQIAVALAAEPDVLLLDEPSNHLDAGGRAWLIGALRRFTGVGVLVSHDRALLDEVTHATLRLASGKARLWRGGYSQAREAWEREARERAAEKERLTRERDRLRVRLAGARRDRQAAEHARGAGARMRNRHDADARGVGAQTLADWAEGRLGRRVEVIRRAHQSAEAKVRAVKIEEPVGRDDVWLGYEPSPRPLLLSLSHDVGLFAGSRQLLGRFSVTVSRNDRIHVAGANGAGKSTLLRALLERASLPAERVLYMPQEVDCAVEGRAVLDELRALPKEARGRALALVAALGLDPDHALATELPSPGETRKLLLGLALARQAWLLVLDEPTNHLDLPSIERLEGALASWPGALLLVTHEAALAAKCTDVTWVIEAGALQVHGAFG